MTVWCYADSRKAKSCKIAKIFASGCNGLVKIDSKVIKQGDIFLYGVTPRQLNLWEKIKKSHMNYYYADNAYLPSINNTEFIRITKNDYQLSKIGKGDKLKREKYLPKIKPWRMNGRDIVICLQSIHHHKLFGPNREIWLRYVIDELSKYTDRPMIIRDKPLRSPGTPPIEQVLNDAWAVVCHSSRVANEAIVNGIPAFVTAKCAASPMALSDLSFIENPFRPDNREEWIEWIAANQWSIPEIVGGKAWAELQEK